MLNIQEVANFLNDKLNDIGSITSTTYAFNIMAEVGKHKNDNTINGIIRNVGGDVVAKSGFVGAEYNFVVELSIPCGNSNFNLINIEAIVNSLINSYNATLQTFTGGKGVITLQIANPKDFNIAYGVGDTVPLVFSVRVEYTEGGVLGVEKHWLLDGVEIPFLMEYVGAVREGKTAKVGDSTNDKTYNKTLMTAQTRQYKFSMKYDGTNAVCQKIQRDILNSDFNKTYTLTYYDGVNFTQASPFTHLVYMLPSGESDSENAKIGVLNVQFGDADDGLTKNRYYLRPVKFPFADGDENTRYFASAQAQIDYFNDSSNLPYVQIKAPNLDSLQLMSQIYTGQGQEPSVLMQYNYAVLKIEQYTLSEGEWTLQSTDYYYYFITSAQQGSDQQVIYNLKMDTVQSFLFNGKVGKIPAFIEKAHLDRFIDNNDGTVSFNGAEDSPLFEREDVQGVAKRMIRRKGLGFKVDTTENSPLNAWLDKYVAGWDYYYMTKSGSANGYQMYKGTSPTTLTDVPVTVPSIQAEKDNILKLAGVLRVMCVPVFKSKSENDIVSLKLRNYEDKEIEINSLGVDFFKENNNGSSYIYARKFSTTPPFKVQDYTGLYSISEQIAIINNVTRITTTLTIDHHPTNYSIWGTVGAFGYGTWYDSSSSDYYGYGVMFASVSNDMDLLEYNATRPLTFGKIANQEILLDSFSFAQNGGANNPIQTVKVFRPSKLMYPTIKIALRFTYNGSAMIENFTLTNSATGLARGDMYGHTVEVKNTYIEVKVPFTYSSNAMTYPNPSYLYGIVPHILQGTNANPTPKNVLFNPKLLSADYAGLKLTNERGGGFEYDLQKLNQQTIQTLYTEPPVPDISRSYFRVTDTDGVYIDKCNENMTGFVDGADMSLMVDNTQLAQVLAENKNFYLQQTMGVFEPAATGLIGGALAGGPAGLVTGAIGAVGGLVTGIINKNLSIDNMKNAPNTIKNANGSAYFNVQCSEMGPIIEEYDILDNEKEIINDHMFKYGFNYNRLGDIMTYINKRKYFSFVKGYVDQFQTSAGAVSALNNVARADLMQRFADGVRFWQSDVVQYQYENYEKWIEDDYYYDISTTLTNMTADPDNPTQIYYGETKVLTFTASTGYDLPASVTVTGATGSWDATTGELTISNPTGDVSITASGVAKTYNITTRLTNATASATNPTTITTGTEATLTFTASTGYNLPSSVTVSGASFTWNKTTGTLVLKNPTANVVVRVTGTQGYTVSGTMRSTQITDRLLVSFDNGSTWATYTLPYASTSFSWEDKTQVMFRHEISPNKVTITSSLTGTLVLPSASLTTSENYAITSEVTGMTIIATIG